MHIREITVHQLPHTDFTAPLHFISIISYTFQSFCIYFHIYGIFPKTILTLPYLDRREETVAGLLSIVLPECEEIPTKVWKHKTQSSFCVNMNETPPLRLTDGSHSLYCVTRTSVKSSLKLAPCTFQCVWMHSCTGWATWILFCILLQPL